MAAPGWFGKVSSLGDFASRRLPPACVSACDRWLSECIACSQSQLGERWLQAYLSAPAWRFAWAPQVMDTQWWFGVLMPSCDKVGRYFPLLLAQARATPPVDRFALDHLDLWWAQAAQAALLTLGEGAELADFEAALDALPPWPSARVGPAWGVQTGAAERVELPAGATLVELAHELAASGLQERLRGHSVWWPWQPQASSVHCQIVPGLPAPADFAQLILTPG